MTDKKNAVVGLVFDERGVDVCLLKKLKGPPDNIGKLLGPGGKIELDELANIACSREFEEETGVWILPAKWKQLSLVHCYDENEILWHVYFFWTKTDDVYKVKQQPGETEIPEVFDVNKLLNVAVEERKGHHVEMVGQLYWMFEFLLHDDMNGQMGEQWETDAATAVYSQK